MYVIIKASGQQQAISKLGSMLLTHMLFKDLLNYGHISVCFTEGIEKIG